MHATSLFLALLLDHLLGEPRRAHPLVAFGKLAAGLEERLHNDSESAAEMRLRGALAAALLILPPTLLVYWLSEQAYGWIVSLIVLYLAIGLRSLREHARAVSDALRKEDLSGSRQAVGYIVSRDTSQMSERDCAKATLESVLENGCDAVFGALFWFIVAGAPGVVVYRLANTLDAMWGYRTTRHLHFGWFAARFDDLLNWPAARLTALSYALSGNTVNALICWRKQGGHWKSPNAGPVMSSGAGALSLSLGGGAHYHGEWQARPELGHGPEPDGDDIERGLSLIDRATWLWALMGSVILLAML